MVWITVCEAPPSVSATWSNLQGLQVCWGLHARPLLQVPQVPPQPSLPQDPAPQDGTQAGSVKMAQGLDPARTASRALSNVLRPYILSAASDSDQLLRDPVLRSAVVIHNGKVTHPRLAATQNAEYVALEELA